MSVVAPEQVNALPLELQEKWIRLENKGQDAASFVCKLEGIHWVAGAGVGFLSFVAGVPAIGWGLWWLFDSKGWIANDPLWAGVGLVAAIIASVALWVAVSGFFARRASRSVLKWCAKQADRHADKVNQWWQKVDDALEVQGLPGVHRKYCAVGPRAVLDNRQIVRVETDLDGVWLVQGWNTRLTAPLN